MARMIRSRRYALLCALAALILPWSYTAPAKNTEKDSCNKTVLNVGKDVERVSWPVPAFHITDFIGFVTYRDGDGGILKGNGRGLCDLDIGDNARADEWLTPDEGGRTKHMLGRWPDANIDDTTSAAKPGPVDESPFMAFLANRTEVYDHRATGRAYHLTRLVAYMIPSSRYRFTDLPPDRVFMSRRTNPFAVARDGIRPVVFGFALIEAHVTRGPALSVYAYFEGRLQLLARTPWHGDRRGWLTVVQARDLDRDGCPEVAVIRDPQNSGTLEIWELRHEASTEGTPFTLVKRAEADGFSNHDYGTASARISVVLDVDGDGNNELIVPDGTRTTLRVMSLKGDRLREMFQIALPGPAKHDLAYHATRYDNKRALNLVVPLEDGTIRLVPVDNPQVPFTRPSAKCTAQYVAPGQR